MLRVLVAELCATAWELWRKAVQGCKAEPRMRDALIAISGLCVRGYRLPRIADTETNHLSMEFYGVLYGRLCDTQFGCDVTLLHA